jgi:hypothetical protein
VGDHYGSIARARASQEISHLAVAGELHQPEKQIFDHLEAPPEPLASLVPAAKASIVDPSASDREILVKLDQTLARYEEGRLQVAALGQFKRGKSTLLNAILGAPLLRANSTTPISSSSNDN